MRKNDFKEIMRILTEFSGSEDYLELEETEKANRRITSLL